MSVVTAAFDVAMTLHHAQIAVAALTPEALVLSGLDRSALQMQATLLMGSLEDLLEALERRQ